MAPPPAVATLPENLTSVVVSWAPVFKRIAPPWLATLPLLSVTRFKVTFAAAPRSKNRNCTTPAFAMVEPLPSIVSTLLIRGRPFGPNEPSTLSTGDELVMAALRPGMSPQATFIVAASADRGTSARASTPTNTSDAHRAECVVERAPKRDHTFVSMFTPVLPRARQPGRLGRCECTRTGRRPHEMNASSEIQIGDIAANGCRHRAPAADGVMASGCFRACIVDSWR